jgi:Xaa-Pro aminopeptidase
MFAPSTYTGRRAALAERLDGLVVLLGNANAPMNYAGNVYPFRQDGSFLYYAGLDEPGLALALDADSGEATLYGHEPTMADTIWEGPLASLGERAGRAGIRRTAPPEALRSAVGRALGAGRAVHVLPPYRGEHRLRLGAILGTAPEAIAPSRALIDAVVAQRLVKTDEEVAEIETAVAVAVEMHHTAMRLAQPGTTEHEIAAAMRAVAEAQGGFTSFPLIVTRRGEVLHNHASGAVLEAGDLLLHDGGAAAPSRYVSDLTRVSPVGGTFSERQRQVVALVGAAQEAALEACAPGVPFRDVHDLACRTIAEHLTDMGLMTGDPAEAVAAGAHALFMPHGLGHAMGLDVHDMEGLGEDRVGYGDEASRSEQFGTAYLRFGRPLAEGHVMTVEPGCYFIGPLVEQWKADGTHADFLDFDEIERWVGLGGVRIEDDIVITSDGHRVLGPELAKTPEAIEAVVRGG